MEELLGSVAGGGLLGLFGSITDRFMNIWERREARQDRIIQNSHELQLISEQRQTAQMETEQEIAVASTRGSYEGLSASLNHDASLTDVAPWVNNIRALVRPFITGITLAAVIVMAATMTDQLQMDLVEATTFIATTATVWWFGDRAKTRQPSTGLSA